MTLQLLRERQQEASAMESQKRTKKRTRIAISCTECHRRKQKCDRRHPCCNCIKRQTRDLCHYQSRVNKSGPPTSATSNSNEPEERRDVSPRPRSQTSEIESPISNYGYVNHSSHNTLGLLRATDHHLHQKLSSSGPPPDGDGFNVKYNNLIRRVPSPAAVDIHIQTFFSIVNWQYDILDEQQFLADLEAWRCVTHSDLCAEPGILALEARVFPALLLQVLAHSLLFHSSSDTKLNSVINIQGMAFDELGKEYSDTSAEILTMLGKRTLTIATIQTGLLRASFLKSSGKVVESWHLLGATIRDAQELGLHKIPTLSSRQGSDGARLWVVLHLWDVHMAVVLGRPIMTDLDIDTFSGDMEDTSQRKALFSHWESEIDPPRPFDVILAGYHVAYKYFPEVHRVDTCGTQPHDRKKADAIHASVERNMRILPSWCRLENPDTKFDKLPQCRWLPIARDMMASLVHLVLLALHRPFMFSASDSCRKAVRAGLTILHAQERFCDKMDLRQCKIFTPVYASFDAVVLLAAAHLAVPQYVSDLRDESLKTIEASVERLDAIALHNPMARTAQSVVQSLYIRLKGGLSTSEVTNLASTQNNCSDGGINSEPIEDPFRDTVPPQPIHDLFYNNLSGSQDSTTASSLLPTPVSTLPSDAWAFEGTFSDDSFWKFMNNIDFQTGVEVS